VLKPVTNTRNLLIVSQVTIRRGTLISVLEVVRAKWQGQSNTHVHRAMCTYAFRLIASGSDLKVIKLMGRVHCR
jgi:hypothetical protein